MVRLSLVFITGIVLTSLISSEVRGQVTVYKPFRVNFSLGFPFAFGLTGAIEPQVHINKRLTIGAEFQLACSLASLQSFNAIVDGKPEVVDNTGIYSKIFRHACLTTDYYLNDKHLRTFVGLGAGLEIRADHGQSFHTKNVADQFSGFPRIGFETGHFRLLAAYYILSDRQSFMQIKAGFFLGGGKRK